ncbi:RagB/SusD family nutrient uptake outer membrane protein [Chitinophaga horti]|uniref:RagB/SusD family nutrient uptake outer membrane protein n=1 Tax=Chitinophaga horti TaxID=2920382 RepID=A0ABY6IW49_9BACT|nr:RagB/SusD family nutrient uptake outer membrane protein [Chitinophaga horti]UYQ91426.1 RagB/SusD family nutrient uptake outer membrane protein [Chitinophaga horti]
MKHTIYSTLFLLALTLGACKKSFLEITPSGKVIAETTADYDLLLNSLTLGNQFMTYAQAMGDEMAAIEPYFGGTTLQQQRAFKWESTIYEREEDAPEIMYPTTALYIYNKIINEVSDSKNGSDAQKNEVKAEALAGRAWTYLQLINIFAKPYNASTASADPGFPIIREADVTMGDFPRSTVKEVYDFIIKDLQDAIPGLRPVPLHRFRMSRPAAEALLAKTYLFMGNFTEALPHLNNAMAGIAASTYPVILYDYNTAFATGPLAPVTEFGPSIPNLYNNQESLYSRQTMGDWTSLTNALLLRPETMALYGASDQRRVFTRNNPFPGGAAFPRNMAQRVAPFSPIIGMVVPDVYLMRAEVRARLNDLTGAVSDLEALRVKRMPAADASVPAPVAADRASLVKFILEERIREFAALGYRWFDMRRLSVDPEFNGTVNKQHILYTADGNISQTFTLTADRLTFKLPPKVLFENPGMQDNP